MKKHLVFALIFSALTFTPAFAQTSNCKVSTAAPTYSNGATAPLSCDTTGALRTAGGGGGANVNLTGINGTAPSATNPLYVAPATANNPWPVTGPLTDTQLRATPVPVSGPLTDTQLRATPVPVSGTVTATDAANGSTGSAVPATAKYVGANSGGNLTGLIQANASVAINVSTATTTQLVALSGSTKIYVTSFDVISGGTGNITFVYGTGSNCGTGTTSLTGSYNLIAQAGIAKGNGLGPVLVVPAGNALCVTTSAAVQMSGSVSYTQF